MKAPRWFHILLWKILRHSRVFRYWYEKHLNDLLYDIELTSLEYPEVKEKYWKKLKYIREHGW